MTKHVQSELRISDHLELNVWTMIEMLIKNTDKSRIRNQIYTMEYYSAIKKNTFESVLMRWMKLEPIIQSEVSQKEKHWNLERW